MPSRRSIIYSCRLLRENTLRLGASCPIPGQSLEESYGVMLSSTWRAEAESLGPRSLRQTCILQTRLHFQTTTRQQTAVALLTCRSQRGLNMAMVRGKTERRGEQERKENESYHGNNSIQLLSVGSLSL